MVLDELIEYEDDESTVTTLNVRVDHYSDTDLCNLFNELRENTTVEMVCIESAAEDSVTLGEKSSLALAAAVSRHPAINRLSFSNVQRMNFGAIAVSVQQNKGLFELGLHPCDLSHEQMRELEWLLAENGIERITIDT